MTALARLACAVALVLTASVGSAETANAASAASTATPERPAAAPAKPTSLPWTDAQRREVDELHATAIRTGTMWCVRTPRFVVRTEVDSRFTAEMARYLELFAAEAGAALLLPPPVENEPAEVTCYGSRERYQRGIGKQACSRGQFDWWYSGEGSRPTYVIRTYIAGPGEATFARFCLPILNHEVAHYLLQQCAGRRRIPDAIHEGVASYLQSWDPYRDAEWNRTHRPIAFAADLRRSISESSLPSFALLTVVSAWDVDNFGPQTNARYASAESFVAFLLSAPQRSPFFRDLLQASFTGRDVRALVMGEVGTELEASWRQSLGLPR